jgi:hypothetical protein
MKFVKPLVVIGCILAALVLLAELVVRLAFPVAMEPAGRLTLTNDMPGIKASVDFRYDGDLLRKINWSGKRSSKNLRVLCLGGSGTTAMLQSAPDTWWGLLAKDLEKTTGKTVEVAALADLQGGQIIYGLVKAEQILEKYDVDLIVASFGFGDAIGQPGDYRFDAGKLQRMRESTPKGLKYAVAKASHLVRIVRNKRRARSQKQRQSALAKPNFYRDYLIAANQYFGSRPAAERIVRSGDDPLKEYLQGVEGLVTLSKKKGCKLLLVGEPTIYKSSLGAAEQRRLTVPWHPTTPVPGKVGGVRLPPLVVETELQRLYREAAAICEKAGVGWCNLQGEVPRYADTFLSETYLTDAGCRVVAEKLLQPVLAEISGKD